MTERIDPARPTGPDAGDGASSPGPAGPLGCAYSPRWLSGPSHYDGLVATFVADPDQPSPAGGGADVASGETSA
jgi:hypothetical protein